jgi:hypothetical protein
MMPIRRRFLILAGTMLALPAVSRICSAQPSQGGPKLTLLLKADLQRQGQVVQETLVNLLDGAGRQRPLAYASWRSGTYICT